MRRWMKVCFLRTVVACSMESPTQKRWAQQRKAELAVQSALNARNGRFGMTDFVSNIEVMQPLASRSYSTRRSADNL